MSSPSNDAESTDDLLIAYALGALEPAELREVADLVRARPELRQRIAEFQLLATQLPYALPTAEPAPDLRARVLARASGTEQPRPPTGAQRGGWFRSWGLSALLGALAVLLLVATLVIRAQLGQQQQQLAQQTQMIERQQQQLGEQQQFVALLNAPGAQLATISDEAGSATLIRAPDNGAALAARLKPLAADRTYQVWLLAGDQPPTSAGLLAVSASGDGVLLLPASQPTLSEAAVFAITIEPSGGSAAPTTTPIVSSPFGPS
ncbi:MAG: anti-sigma factor [Chloroflexales bacterium]|nr:anti-sigma factor [Chloroflexales bacterium]